MKMPKVNRQIALATGIVIAGTIAGVVALSAPQSGGATDSPLTTQVDNQQKELDNHEARITNTENDVKDLQNNTGTAPSTNKVSVPTYSSTPTSTATTTTDPTPVPITVVSYEVSSPGGLQSCKLTYSDGTVKYFSASVFAPGQCDDSTIGQPKN